MNPKIEELIQTLKGIEEEMEAEFRKKREEFHFTVEEKGSGSRKRSSSRASP